MSECGLVCVVKARTARRECFNSRWCERGCGDYSTEPDDRSAELQNQQYAGHHHTHPLALALWPLSLLFNSPSALYLPLYLYTYPSSSKYHSVHCLVINFTSFGYRYDETDIVFDGDPLFLCLAILREHDIFIVATQKNPSNSVICVK